MKNDPLVSIIMCVYKTPIAFLSEAINSILGQTYHNYEFIIVDDGTPDDGGKFCDECAKKDKRIRVVHKENGGLSSARNVGIDLSKGKYIALMDTDDIAFPERIAKQVAYMESNNDVVVLGTWYKHFGDKTNEVKVMIEDQELYRAKLFFKNVPTILNPSVMIRRSIVELHGIRYNEELRFAEDYLFWVQMSIFGKIVNYPETLMLYRVHPNQATNVAVRKKLEGNVYLINDYQLKQIGIKLDKEDINLYFCKYADTYKNILKVKLLLDKIACKNKETQYFDHEKFQMCCCDYLYECMSRLRSPFRILRLLINKNTSKIMRKAFFDKIKRKCNLKI